MIKNILFDLDGTLVNCEKLQARVLKQLFINHKVDYINIDFTTLIGPPLINTFAKYFGKQNANNVMKEYENIFKDIKIHNVFVMPEIDKLLSELKRRGKNLYVTSLQIKDVVNEELEYLGLRQYFTKILADNPMIPYKDKAELIADFCKSNCIDKNETVVIGDTDNDLSGGSCNGIRTIYVNWGYQKHKKNDKQIVVDTVDELLDEIENL